MSLLQGVLRSSATNAELDKSVDRLCRPGNDKDTDSDEEWVNVVRSSTPLALAGMLTERLAGICTWNPRSHSPTIANQGISPRITYTNPDLQEEPRPAQGVPDGGVAADILEAEDTRSVEVHAGVQEMGQKSDT